MARYSIYKMSNDNSRLTYAFQTEASSAKSAFKKIAGAGYLTSGRYIVIKNLKQNSSIFKH